MAPGKLLEVRQPGHVAVRPHDFADYPCRRQTGQAREVHGSFGMAGALQHAAGARRKREDMAGAGKVARHSLFIQQHLDGVRPIIGADAGGHSMTGIHRLGKSRAHIVGLMGDGRARDVQLRQTLGGHGNLIRRGHGRHEINGAWRNLGGSHPIAFVLAAFIITIITIAHGGCLYNVFNRVELGDSPTAGSAGAAGLSRSVSETFS